MRSPKNCAGRPRGEASTYVMLVVVVVGVLGGGWYYLKSSRGQTEKGGREFANQVMQRVVLGRDLNFLTLHLSPQAKLQYPPSFCMRLISTTRDPGEPNPNYNLRGEMKFQNQFFEPNGTFIGEFSYPSGPASLEVHISHPAALWQIDDINWTWTPSAPTPTPVPVVSATPTPSPAPTPTPTPEHRRRKKG